MEILLDKGESRGHFTLLLESPGNCFVLLFLMVCYYTILGCYLYNYYIHSIKQKYVEALCEEQGFFVCFDNNPL